MHVLWIYLPCSIDSTHSLVGTSTISTRSRLPLPLLCSPPVAADSVHAGVGKTCLLLRYANDSFSQTFITTIGIDFKIKNIDL